MTGSEEVALIVASISVIGGISGTVLAGLLSQRSSQKQEERRWRREDRSRWHEDRRDIYARFLGLGFRIEIEKVYLIEALIAYSETGDMDRYLQTTVDGMERAKKSLEELMETSEAIRVFSTERVRECASEVTRAVIDVHQKGPPPGAEIREVDSEQIRDEFADAAMSLDRVRAEFRDAVRVEFGIVGVDELRD